MVYQPLVSIIIPVYNGSNFMRKAIDSAINQTYKNIEIIVVNDGSTDNGATEQIALSYGEKIKYFPKQNGGVSTALNYAFTVMNGEWFSWLSHDDVYLPQKIEKQIEFINKLIEENPDIDISKITVRSATESIDKDGKVIKRPSYKNVPVCENPIDTILNNVSNYRLSGCSFLLPATCVADVGDFREDIRTVSDVEYWYRLLFNGYTFYCLSNDILVQNRSHGKQVGKTKVELFNKEMNDLFVSIADSFFSCKAFYNIKNMEKYYIALRRRKCNIASKYVKLNYIKGKAPFFDYYLKLPSLAFINGIRGTIHNILRFIYRKIKVR